ncbi:Topoisomerase 1-associated factor 1 [Vanrija pseudolonga]|uniref:Topoisomerase 1-associated factor 1 n=1 Tax=Vanrija pseudolonga TaxID=143232 RepID=A0AAF0YG05_9TREE|nr:Topoisomerase 1-associated factor 1 [Vanrija pseudolonga]
MSSLYGSSPTREGMFSDLPDRHVAPDILAEEDRFEVFMPAVQSLVNALGGYEEMPQSDGTFMTVYRPGDSVLPVLKDLKKLWRKDDTDDERTVARCMAKAGLMKELVALVKEVTDRGEWGRKISLMSCDLIAALTWPIDVAKELKEMEEEGPVVTDYASLLRAQVEYKAQLLQGDTLRYIMRLLTLSFAKQGRREEKDERIISLGLHIVRNLLAIRDVVAPDNATGEQEELSHLQSTLITQLQKFEFMDMFLVLASHADRTEFNPFNMLILDVTQLLFRSVKPVDLARDPVKAPVENLAKLLSNELQAKIRKARAAPSRHSRFGTTITVKAGGQKVILHSQDAIAQDAAKVLDEIKKKRTGRQKKADDLTVDAYISPEAMAVLLNFGKELLKDFDSFFESVRKDIQMERSKVRPADSVRALYVSSFMMEFLLILRKKELDAATEAAKATGEGPEAATAQVDHDLPLGRIAVMAELDTVRWVASRMKSTMDDHPPAWTELEASINCFTQILLLIEAMSHSSDEEDSEAAAIIQNQLYYNGDILDASLQVVSNYKDQSVGYLEAIIHFAYVLLRMLERYSKDNAYMYALKAHNTGEAPIPEEYANDEEEDIGPDEDAPSYREHAFTFASFEQRFASEAVARTLLAYLARYSSFDDIEKVKRVVGLMHRQVVKAQAEGLYFKVSSMYLFGKVLEDQASLPKGKPSKDLVELIGFVLRKFFKRMAEDPFMIVDAFGPKSRGRWKQHSSYKSDEEEDDGMGGQRARIQEKLGPAELEFIKKHKLSWSQQMGVVVKMLVDADHEEWVRWMINVLEIVLAARTEIVLSVDGERNLSVVDSDGERATRDFSGPSADAIAKFAQLDLEPDSDELKAAVRENAHFRLMLKLLNFEATEAEDIREQKWFLPSKVLPSTISSAVGALNQFLITPVDLDEDPKKLIRRTRRRRAASPGSDSDIDRLPRKRRAQKAAEVQQFKSAAFIVDSDDDEDADAAFFAREEALRLQMQEKAEEAGNIMRETGTKKRKRGKRGGGPLTLDDMEGVVEGGEDVVVAEEEEGVDADDESEPGSPSTPVPRPSRRQRAVLSASPNATPSETLGADSDDDDADAVVSRRVRPRPTQRVIDPDDDE